MLKKSNRLGIKINLFLAISTIKFTINIIKKINKGIESIFIKIASIKLNDNKAKKALVKPHPGQEIPVNCLKAQFTGKKYIIIKNNTKQNNIKIFINLLFITKPYINLLMDYHYHQH